MGASFLHLFFWGFWKTAFLHSSFLTPVIPTRWCSLRTQVPAEPRNFKRGLLNTLYLFHKATGPYLPAAEAKKRKRNRKWNGTPCLVSGTSGSVLLLNKQHPFRGVVCALCVGNKIIIFKCCCSLVTHLNTASQPDHRPPGEFPPNLLPTNQPTNQPLNYFFFYRCCTNVHLSKAVGAGWRICVEMFSCCVVDSGRCCFWGISWHLHSIAIDHGSGNACKCRVQSWPGGPSCGWAALGELLKHFCGVTAAEWTGYNGLFVEEL